jgi:signal peptidase I
VIEVLDDGGTIRYRTQGDANEDPDPFVVKQEMVVGKYSFQIPKWGLLIQAMRSKVGYVLLVLLPCSIILAREFVSLYKQLDERDRAKRAAKEGRA